MEKTPTQAIEIKLNWLRASVLGANDGIVSIAGVVMGLVGAGADRPTILLAGLAAVVAGAISMAGGEFTSVSAQRDTEIAHGRDKKTLSAHPWRAAWSSAVAFMAGAVLPMVAATGPWADYREPVTIVSVVLALAVTGWWVAVVGGGSKRKSIARNVAVSLIAMGLAYLVGLVLGVTVFA